MELPSLRVMTQAGGKLPTSLQREFAQYAADKGIEFVLMYGATEATARMGYLPPQKAYEKLGCMGIAIPGGRFELIDDAGDTIEASDIPGELVYYGDNVTMGYAECGEDLQKGDENKGRYATGDVATRDDEGYYTIVGRKSRFLKVFGNRIDLDEVERMLHHAFPAVECACVGVDDAMTIYVANCDDEVTEVIARFLCEKTGIHRSAFKAVGIASIPRSGSGKTLYSELR
jgi:acyl-coenzyme A synthetase/AMP-(fatty) acid ligase